MENLEPNQITVEAPASHRGRVATLLLFLAGVAVGGIAVGSLFLFNGRQAPSGGSDQQTLNRLGREVFGNPSQSPVQNSPEAGRLVQQGGVPLLPVPATSDITVFAGQPVGGDQTIVQSVVSDRGFWIGGPQDRLFVRVDEPGVEPIETEAGGKVDVQGILLQVPPDFEEKFDIGAKEDAEQLKGQGVYLHALTLRNSGD